MPRNPQRPQAFFAFTGYWWLNVNVGRSGIISGQGRCWGWERNLPVCGEGGSLVKVRKTRHVARMDPG